MDRRLVRFEGGGELDDSHAWAPSGVLMIPESRRWGSATCRRSKYSGRDAVASSVRAECQWDAGYARSTFDASPTTRLRSHSSAPDGTLWFPEFAGDNIHVISRPKKKNAKMKKGGDRLSGFSAC